MNPDLANLLGALRDQPDDEIASLALADWCLDQPDHVTQARGEHVRLSLQLGKMPLSGYPQNHARESARRELRDQVKALEKRHRIAWLGSMRDLAHRCAFLPGGLLKVDVTAGRTQQAREAKIAPPSASEFAWVSSLVARTVTLDDLSWLADQLPAGCLSTFVLDGAVEPGSGLVDVLARCRWLAGIRALDHRYHPNWLHNLLVSSSLAGFRRPLAPPQNPH